MLDKFFSAVFDEEHEFNDIWELKLIKFDERDKLQQSMEPVLAAYAKEIGADAIYARINAIK